MFTTQSFTGSRAPAALFRLTVLVGGLCFSSSTLTSTLSAASPLSPYQQSSLLNSPQFKSFQSSQTKKFGSETFRTKLDQEFKRKTSLNDAETRRLRPDPPSAGEGTKKKTESLFDQMQGGSGSESVGRESRSKRSGVDETPRLAPSSSDRSEQSALDSADSQVKASKNSAAQDDSDSEDAAPPVTNRPDQVSDLFYRIGNQRITKAGGELRWSLNDAIAAALNYSNRVSALRIRSVEEFQNVGVQSGQFDPVAFVNQSFRDSATPVGSVFDTATGAQPIVEEDDFNFDFGVRRRLRSGGEFEISQAFRIRDNDSGILVPDDQATGILQARLRKDLLRGAGRSIAMNQVLTAYFDANSRRALSVTEIASHLNDVMTAYWDIFSARASLLASIENRLLAVRVLEQLKQRTDIDAERNLLDQSEATIRQRDVLVNQAHNALISAQIRFVALINAPELINQARSLEILPQVEQDLVPRDLDVDARVNTAITRRPEIADIIEQIKAAKLANHVSLNDLLPILSLSLDASLNGLEGDRRLGTAFGNQFETKPTYQVGFNFEVPIHNRQARFTQRRTELTIARLQANWQDRIESIKADVITNAQTFTASELQLQKQREVLMFSSRELDYLNLRKSIAPRESSNPSFALTQVLAAQDRRANAKTQLFASIANRYRALFELNRATGILVNEGTIPEAGVPRRPGFISVYHQYLEEKPAYGDAASTIESTAKAKSKVYQRDFRNEVKVHPNPTYRLPDDRPVSESPPVGHAADLICDGDCVEL